MDETFPFDHFMPEAITFFRQLAKNNEREWFQANKERYETYVKADAQAFCNEMTPLLSDMTGVPHQSKMFRIHRDVRFSKDKRPYKAHLHILFRPVEDRANQPAWFFGLEPKGLFFGVGVMGMQKGALDHFRARVAGPDGEDLEKVLESFARKSIRVRDPELKRVPNQYGQDHPRGALLKHKSLTAWVDHDTPDAALQATCLKTCKAEFRKIKPLFDWFMDG
ncbi:MAG: DUF2461 domain-containing protein [Alphaproteobacteria bacterium]